MGKQNSLAYPASKTHPALIT